MVQLLEVKAIAFSCYRRLRVKRSEHFSTNVTENALIAKRKQKSSEGYVFAYAILGVFALIYCHLIEQYNVLFCYMHGGTLSKIFQIHFCGFIFFFLNSDYVWFF